ncbi:MAG: AAA family ATPase, partial [Caldilineaceae bacterium]|nr:AAA family ATPase [Caldilineaceae bacterium]
MISDSPEFKAELDSITRLGRAQGINLLLAAQRPTGVTDQMRENIKYRICLRVEGVDTSREMLRRSDAAFLPSGMPGRGYLQIGNEAVELIQVAYTGETYEYATADERGRRPKFYDMVVNMAQDLAGDRLPSSPWPPFLPTKLTLSTKLDSQYMDRSYAQVMTLGQRDSLDLLNPFVAGWLQDQPGWGHIDWARTAMRAIVGLTDDPAGARQLPLVLDMTRGHAVLFGASGYGKSSFLRTLVVSLAASHSPDEFHAHVLDLGGRNLEILRELPHVGTLVMPDEQGYEEIVQQLLRELDDEVEERKHRLSDAKVTTVYEYNSSGFEPTMPAILVVIDNFAEFLETFKSDTAEEGDETNVLEAFVALARQSRPYGIHFIITATRFNVLNSKLYSLFTERLTLRLADADDYSSIVGMNIGDIDEIPGRGFVRMGRGALEFQTAVSVGHFDDQGQLRQEAQQIVDLGEKMKRLGQWEGKGPLRIGALPTSSSYRHVLARPELFHLDPAENYLSALQAAALKKWQESCQPDEADWLAVTLGIASGDRPRTLRLAASKDGVHGLVAGGTGSGKSELLMTLIIGLALNYDPSILNFVLVDYKGGGAFKPFEQLPHCVDLITNLGKAGVDRMFTAINAEMRRRQRMNTETQTKDIVDYRRKGYHLRWPDGTPGKPYPHLFIIIDEYAEMIDDNPDYKAQLESITRVGRAQGVNLLLASQRPKGVTDQMRANIKLRLCLRVEETDTSIELLRRPDAAYLPNGLPGRGYLQIGNDNAELIQVSWTGESQADDRAAAVLWPEHTVDDSALLAEDTPKFYDAVVMLAQEMNHGQMAPRVWPAFLPNKYSLQSAIYDAQRNESYTLMTVVSDWLNGDVDELWRGVDWHENAMQPVVGLVDDPLEARQYPLEFALSRNHLAVFGDTGWGKTSLLRTIMVSLATTHSPDELHIYILDLGGRNFTTVAQLPHVGAMISSDEEEYEERLMRLLDRLETIIAERQRLFGDAGVGTLRDYNSQFPDKRLPAVLVIIDNFADLRESYEMLVESTVTPLIRRRLSTGISFVISANTHTEIPSKVYNLLGERITFMQADAERYMDIVGRGTVELDEVAGRGYIRRDGRPLQFQAALPVGIFDPEDGHDIRTEADELRRLAAQMKRRGGWQHEPLRIDTLPTLVPLRAILPAELPESGKPNVTAILGMNSALRPASFDLRRTGPHFVVTGPPLSGKTTTLYTWIISMARRYPPTQVMFVLIDLQARFADYGGNQNLQALPHTVAYITDAEELPGLTQQLDNECQVLSTASNNRKIYIVVDNFDDLGEELLSSRDNDVRDAGNALVRIARRMGP